MNKHQAITMFRNNSQATVYQKVAIHIQTFMKTIIETSLNDMYINVSINTNMFEVPLITSTCDLVAQ